MVVPTGVPPHIGLAVQLQKILVSLGGLVERVDNQSDNLVASVEKAIDTKAWDSGHVTGSRLKEILDQYKKEAADTTMQELESIRVRLQKTIRDELDRGRIRRGGGDHPYEGEEPDDHFVGMDSTSDDGGEGPNGGGGGGQGKTKTLYPYDGRFFGVPQNWVLPKVTLKEALYMWLCEQRWSEDANEKIRPWRMMEGAKAGGAKLPPMVRARFRTNWVPFLGRFLDPVLKDVVAAMARTRSVTMSDEALAEVYGQCVTFLRARVSYLFAGENKPDPLQFTIGTWSKYTSRSWILEHGTEDDKALLGEGSNRNKKKQEGLKRRRAREENPKYPCRQARRIRQRQRQQQQKEDDGGVAFAEAFDHAGLQLNPGMVRRLRAIETVVDDEMKEERIAAEQQRIIEQGVTYREVTGVRNYGDVSDHDRRRMVEILDEALPTTAPPVMRRGHPGDGGFHTGPCCVAGCQFPMLELRHRCHGCKEFVHMCCAEPFSRPLTEDERYCNKCSPYK